MMDPDLKATLCVLFIIACPFVLLWMHEVLHPRKSSKPKISVKRHVRKITDYKVVDGPSFPTTSHGSIEGNVNRLINDGWEPQGGVVLSNSEHIFYQAMIKRENEEKDYHE